MSANVTQVLGIMLSGSLVLSPDSFMLDKQTGARVLDATIGYGEWPKARVRDDSDQTNTCHVYSSTVICQINQS